MTDGGLQMTCSCRSAKTGFTLVKGWWVCAQCHLPTPLYARAMSTGLPIRDKNRKEVIVGLVYFDGGPEDGKVYETSSLMSAGALTIPLLEYLWTTDKITSSVTNQTAQIWRHKSKIQGAENVSTPAGAQKLAQAQGPSASVPTDGAALTVTDLDQTSTSQTTAAAAAPATIEAPAPTPQPVAEAAPATSAPVAVQTSDVPDGAVMLELRNKLKISRSTAAAETELAVSKIIAIETNGGKRLKDEEKAAYWAYLGSKNGGTPAQNGSDASAHA